MSHTLVRTIVGVSIAAGSLVATSPAGATVWKNFQNESYCLGVAGGNMTNGTRLILWDCNGNPDQSWVEGGIGAPYVQLEDVQDIFKCAGVAGLTQLDQYWCAY